MQFQIVMKCMGAQAYMDGVTLKRKGGSVSLGRKIKSENGDYTELT